MGMPDRTINWRRVGYEAAHATFTLLIGGGTLALVLAFGASFWPAMIGTALLSWAFWEGTK